ncbi:hypothetical protein JOM56_001311 [Amanita muscaria]
MGSREAENPINGSTPSTWAARNPGKPILPIRHRPNRPKTQAERETEKMRNEKSQENAKSLQTEVRALHTFLDKAVGELSVKFKKKRSYILTLVHAKSTLKAKRKPNLKNALLHRKAKEVNQGRLDGERLSLVQIQKLIDKEHCLDDISEEQKHELINELQVYRELKQTGSRATSLSAAQDVRQTMQRLSVELQHLFLRTGTCTVLLVSKSHIDDQSIPGWIATGESGSFFIDVLKQDVWDVVRKYEQWVCSRDQTAPKIDSFKKMRSECISLINEGLRQISKQPDTVMMNYVNYDKAIIQKYHVKLIGWPTTIKFMTPANLSSTDDVRKLRNALKTKTCHWIHLSEMEVDEHMTSIAEREAAGEQVGRKRKQRADKGKPRKKTAQKQTVSGDTQSQEPSPSGDSGSTSMSGNSASAAANSTSTIRRTSKYKSKAVLSDTDNEDSEDST